jgi:hypothetical protein
MLRRDNNSLTAGRTLSALTGGAYSALLMMLALTLLLPMAPDDRALLSVVVWPVLWAGITLYLFVSTHPLRTHIQIAIVTALMLAGAAFNGLS